MRDFIYDGPDIVAGPCTAMTGPAEEFATDGSALGFTEAQAGGRFIKIGVGVLQKPDNAKYDMFRLYPIVDAGKRTVRLDSNSAEFTQEISDSTTGYGYAYRKTVTCMIANPELNYTVFSLWDAVTVQGIASAQKGPCQVAGSLSLLRAGKWQ